MSGRRSRRAAPAITDRAAFPVHRNRTDVIAVAEYRRVIALELLPAVAADDPTVVDTIVDVVNRAYMTAETELWRRPLPRTDSEQTRRAIASGEVAVARLDGAIVGSLLVSRTQAGAAKRKILASSAADVQTEPNAYTVSPPLVTAAV
jgi:hypothetical protein